MSEHLWPQLRLKADDKGELKKEYKKIFIKTYIKTEDGDNIEIFDWLGNRIHFSIHSFDHAFSESSNYREKKEHDIPFSKKRARRILWIKEILSASKGTIERRHQVRKDSRKRQKERRTLLVVEENYIVVLEQRKKPGELSFVTAFPADAAYVKNIRKNSVLEEIKKAPVLTATEALPRS